MYELAKKARAGMKSKAERLAGEKDRKTDSSNWSPAEPLNADVKTGMRPVSRRAYKSGGKVEGCAPKGRADRKPRKAGGRVEQKGEQPLVDRYINRDLKKANEYRDGTKHVGALKHGGRAHKANGGSMTMEEMIKKNPAPVKKPLGLDKVPLPPRRPANLTTAVPNPKPDETKRMKGDYISPQEIGKKHGGRTGKADGGSIRQRFNAEFAKQRAAGAKKFTFEGKEYTTELAKPSTTTGPSTRGRGTTVSPSVRQEKVLDVKFGPVNTDSAGKKVYTPARVMGTGQGTSTSARPSVTPSAAPSRRPSVGMPEVDAMGNPTGGGMKKGGRIKKADGGEIDPRLGIVKPKVMEFGQNVVTPGLKKGGRVKKEVGGAAKAAGVAATQALANAPAISGPAPSTNIPPVGSGILPKTPGNYEKPPAYDPDKYNPKSSGKFGKGFKDIMDRAKVFGSIPGAKKGGRIAKQIGGALGRSMGMAAPGASMNPMARMPQPASMPRQFGGAPITTMPISPMPMPNPAGRAMPRQAIDNAQGRPFQPGGKFATQPYPTTTGGDPFGASMGRMGNRQGMPRPGNIGSPMGVVAGPSSIGGQVGPNVDDNFYSGPVTPDSYAPAPMPNPIVGGGTVSTMPAPMPMPAPITNYNPVDTSQARSYGSGTMGGGNFANGGRIARASGGSAKSKGKGKTNINIIIATGSKKEPQSMIPPAPQAPMGMPPMPAPNAPAAAPMGMPPMPAPPMGGGQPPMPGAFKQGGRVSKVAKSYKDMTAGAGSGEGRLQKTDIAKRSAHKAGGKVYRSYKDMDSGSGSGKGRLEKTEIQSRKR